MESFLLRQAITSDAKGIARVRVVTWQSTYLGLIPDFFLQNLNLEQSTVNWAKRLESSVQSGKTIVAEIDGTIVGYIGIGVSRDLDASDVGELYTIYVDPEHQGKGVGSALIREGIKFLKSISFNKATLWVFDGNERAIKYYETHGWNPTGMSKLDKLGDFELLEIQYAIGF